jgi:hypothetical protein
VLFALLDRVRGRPIGTKEDGTVIEDEAENEEAWDPLA